MNLGSLLEMLSAEAFESDKEFLNSLLTATDDQSDKWSLPLEKLSRE